MRDNENHTNTTDRADQPPDAQPQTSPKAPLGVLLLHGLTSHISCIDPVVPRLEKLGLPYRMPLLRGHGTQPSDLENVRWTDWQADGQAAFDDLLTECEQVIPVALSMGGLVGLNLALANPDTTAAIVCIAPALKLRSRLAPLAPYLARFQKTRPFKYDPKSYFDQKQGLSSQNYKEIPSRAIVEFLEFIRYTRQPSRLSRLTLPILILQATQDLTVEPRIAQFLYDTVASSDRRLIWFDRSGHEMLRDAQREEILDAIEAFLAEKMAALSQASTSKTSSAK